MKVLIISTLLVLLTTCKPANQIEPNTEMPQKIIWAWERPEDLRFLDPKEFGVAFLAQTLFIEKDRVDRAARRQPLEVSDGTYMIAVTRIESNSDGFSRSKGGTPAAVTLTDEVANLITHTLELPNVKSIQIDFDAAVSEREFYRLLINALRKSDAFTRSKDGTAEAVTLTTTSLASWCTGDAWFNDLLVDEAVPMVFVMGADSEKIRNYLRNGNDWREPLCRGSYGISVDESPIQGLRPGRRIWYFKNSSWTKADLERL